MPQRQPFGGVTSCCAARERHHRGLALAVAGEVANRRGDTRRRAGNRGRATRTAEDAATRRRYIQRAALALLLGALTPGNVADIREALQDRAHQPYREAWYPVCIGCSECGILM